MATLKLPKKFIERLNKVAEEEGKTVEDFLKDAINAYKVRETAKEKGEPVPPEAELKKRTKAGAPVAVDDQPKKSKVGSRKKKDEG
jgi:hypothetical protein